VTSETRTYLLFYIDSNGEPQPFYVGESLNPAARLNQHRRDAADPLNEKEAYAFLRESNIKHFEMEVVDGKTERELVTELTLAGCRLFNSNAGIRTTVKKKHDHTFAKLNREAEAVLAIREAAAARRNRLHSDRQSLSKSEIVRQRITGAIPTVDELQACEWFDCPPELVREQLAKTADGARYCKWGDFNVYVAFKNKERETACCARSRVGKSLWNRGAGWTKCGHDRALELLIERWGNEYAEWV